MKQPQSITTLPPSPDEERKGRIVRYLIAMCLRVVCIILCFFVQGWWLLLPIIGAVMLPYFAMIVANVGSGRQGGEVIRPGSVVPVARQVPREDQP